MQVLQGIANLRDPGQHFCFAQGLRPLAEQCRQALPFDEIHDQVLAPAGDQKMVDDARQIGVAQPGQHGRLAPELALGLIAGVHVLF